MLAAQFCTMLRGWSSMAEGSGLAGGIGSGAGWPAGLGAGAAAGAGPAGAPPQPAHPASQATSPHTGLQRWQANRLLRKPTTRSRTGWQRRHFGALQTSQAGSQGFTTSQGLATSHTGLHRLTLRTGGHTSQAGAHAGFSQTGAQAGFSHTLTGSQAHSTLPQRWQANRSRKPLNRSQRFGRPQGGHAGPQGSGAQAFGCSQGAGAAQGAQPPSFRPEMRPKRSPNPWLHRAALSTSAPKTILPFIERSLLFAGNWGVSAVPHAPLLPGAPHAADLAEMLLPGVGPPMG